MFSSFFRKCGEFICLNYSGWGDYEETKLFSLDNPLNPEFYRILNIPSTNSWPRIHNNLLFTKSHNVSFVYDLNESTNDTLHSIDYFDGLFMTYGYDFYDIGDTHYLFVTEPSSVGVYEFNYSYGIDDESELVNDPITCSPNPFRNTTKISFYTTESSENTEIKIYNVRAQLIKSLLSFPNPSLGMIGAV